MMITKRDWLLATAGATLLSPVSVLAQGRRGGRGGATTAANAPPLALDETEKRALEVLEDIDRNQRYLNVSRDDGRLLRILAQSIGARHAVEVGTSTGYSGIWLALALRASGGRLTTYEIDAGRARTAKANFQRAGLDTDTEVVIGDAHVEISKLKGPIDLVFVDADKDGYLDYLRKLLPLVRGGGLFVADNMRVPTPDPAFVQAITTDPRLETLFLNMHSTGMGVSLKKPA